MVRDLKFQLTLPAWNRHERLALWTLGLAAVLGAVELLSGPLALTAPRGLPTAEPSSAPQGAVWISPDGRPMVRITRGPFLMGSPVSEVHRSVGEEPHIVVIPRDFWLDTHEVDNTAYQRFMLSHPQWQPHIVRAHPDASEYLRGWIGTSFPTDAAALPVTSIPWRAARAYCVAFGKRLPYEHEWEFAARAGTTTAYWWGDDFDRIRANNRLHADPVGVSARRNPWGLHDILGNVWEWTESLWMPYPYRSADGREDPASDGERVIRGGAWFLTPPYLRAAFRGWSSPLVASDMVGFRCAA